MPGRPFAEIVVHVTAPGPTPEFIAAVKAWRTTAQAEGWPSTFKDALFALGYCIACRAYGCLVTGWDEVKNLPLWSVCPACQGSGQATHPLN